MKLLFISAHDQDERIAAIRQELFPVFERNQIEVLKASIEDNLPKCIYCEKCLKTGKCIYSDEVNEILEKSEEYDGLLFAGVSLYGKSDPVLKDFMERLFHGKKDRFSLKPAAIIQAYEEGSLEPAGQDLFHYLLANHLLIVSSYDIPCFRPGNERDLQNLRALAENMVWTMKSMEKADIPKPVHEKRIPEKVLR